MLSGGDRNFVSNVSRCAKNLGVLFQIKDDLLDYSLDEKAIGKPVFQDIKEGKLTYPFYFAYNNADKKNKEKLLNSRYRAEKRFQFYGKSAIFLALLFLTIFIFKIFSTGYTAFQKTWLIIPVTFDAETLYLDENPSIEDIEDADYFDLALKSMFDLDKNASEKQQNDLKKMVSYFFEREIKKELLNDPSLIGKTKDVYLTASDDLDQVFKGNYPRDLPENQRRVTDFQLKIFDQLVEQGRVESKFNLSFFTYPDSREAELAGIASSFMGSIFSILVCLVIAFPVAVLAAIYLEEFAPKNKFTDFIEVNINNLAAVPSIVFGLL